MEKGKFIQSQINFILELNYNKFDYTVIDNDGIVFFYSTSPKSYFTFYSIIDFVDKDLYNKLYEKYLYNFDDTNFNSERESFYYGY